MALYGRPWADSLLVLSRYMGGLGGRGWAVGIAGMAGDHPSLIIGREGSLCEFSGIATPDCWCIDSTGVPMTIPGDWYQESVRHGIATMPHGNVSAGTRNPTIHCYFLRSEHEDYVKAPKLRAMVISPPWQSAFRSKPLTPSPVLPEGNPRDIRPLNTW